MERDRDLRHREAERSPAPLLATRQINAVDLIYWTIVQAQRNVYQNLVDADVIAAVDNALKNLETEDAGLIYEHKEFSVVADDISQRIRTAFDKLSEDVPAELLPKRGDVIAALKFVAHTARMHSKPGEARSFLRFIAQFYPWKDAADGSPIVLP
jgi:hypothetical protein